MDGFGTVKERGWESFEVHVRKSPDCYEGIVGRNMYIKGDSADSSKRKRERWRESLHLLRKIYKYS